MDTVQVYVVVGPTKLFMGGRNVPGGFAYLSRSLTLLAELNQNVNFEVKVAHSIYHGELSDFHKYPNMKIKVFEFSNDNFEGLSELDPIVQHGALLNKLFNASPPTSRFILVLDPDCYAIQPNLISHCIQEMKDLKISVAGISYPAWYPKEYTWKTPQLYFCLFDRNSINPEDLDLRAGGHPQSTSTKNAFNYESLTLRILRRIRSFFLNRGFINLGEPMELVLRAKIDLLHRRYEINSRDTGWRLGDKIDDGKLAFKVYPNIINREIKIPGFRTPEYLAVNQDLQHLYGNLGWYFLAQGLTEGRQIGSQGVIPRIIQKFTGVRVIERAKWPSSSLLSALCISNQKELDLVQRAIPSADFYAIGDEFSFFHIGSKGKGQIIDEIRILDDLIDKFVSKSV